MASERAAALAFAQACDEREWALSVPGEGWPVGVVLHHIAEGHAHGARWLQDMARGEGVTETAADVDRVNAVHAVRAEAVGPAETVALLEVNGGCRRWTWQRSPRATRASTWPMPEVRWAGSPEPPVCFSPSRRCRRRVRC